MGFIGRNGRGKTTFLNLLLGKHEYSGAIVSPVNFDYFPMEVAHPSDNTIDVIRKIIAPFDEIEAEMNELLLDGSPEAIDRYGCLLEEFTKLDGYIINELIEKELSKLDVTLDILNRPFNTLSNGETTKSLLCALFLKKNNFLLIDEPTDHLDYKGREIIADYLSAKKSFILVSHDRHFLDKVIDHVLVINKTGLEVQKGNYSSWQLNKDMADNYERQSNEKLKKDITRLNQSARRTKLWSDKIENSKIGEHTFDRGAVGAQSARMMKRAKSIEKRRLEAASEKETLLRNIETAEDLKLAFPAFHNSLFMEGKDISIRYGEKVVSSGVNFKLEKGDRLAIRGANGSGKTSLIKLLLGQDIEHTGYFFRAANLKISYVNQQTTHLKGDLKTYAMQNNIDESLFKAVLRKLGMERIQFEKNLEDFSQGQKKKVLIAGSLCEQAHLYIWDEPLNYIDIISRIQLEELILKYCPTFVFVEHDRAFNDRIATKILEL
ncbi:MAG: ATP-binding cassette domain-containing protein [Clostridiales bacterium]|nr:ATP-binding cassette domain-containing protein [Clostridiales bacterium]